MKSVKSSLFLGGLLACLLVPSSSNAADQTAARIDHVMQSHVAAGDFSGTVLLARDGHILYERAFGFANREWNIPNDLQTKFEIGSMTKQFTALLVLQFVNEKKLDLDGHLSDYLPYYRHDTGSRIKIRDLLDHTSGVPNFIMLPGFLDGPASRQKYSVQEFVQKFCSGDLHFDPGTKFEYSNSGYILLGAVLEQVSARSYEQLLQERIFTLLGMNNSGYAHSETIVQHRASGYERTATGFQNARYYDMSIPFSAGALYSTVEDLLLWDQALYTERLLPANVRDLLFKPNLENYGFGWGILIPAQGAPYAGETVVMHGGAIFGFQSMIQRIPKYRELIVLLDNSDSHKLLEIGKEIRRELAAEH